MNVSKNIKRLRSAKKMTQEQLAETLHVTRQTISSWENDRTQPDVGMLAALAEALDTDIEDLIYGKRKRVGLEAPPADNKRTLSLVLSIFGVLLTAAGLIFMFVYFWQKLPGLTHTVLSLLPLAVGAGAGLYTVIKKKESVPAREGAAVLWFAGVIASNALVNGLFNVDLGFANLLTADILLLLPVMYLLDSVFAFTAEAVMSVLLLQRAVDGLWYEDAGIFWLCISAAAFLCTCVYVFRNGQIRPVKQFCAWIALLGAGVYLTVAEGCFLQNGESALLVAYAFVFALYIADTTKRFALPLRVPALCALCAATFVCSMILFADKYNDWDFESGSIAINESTVFAVTLVLSALLLAASAPAGWSSYRKNPLKIAFTALFGAFFLWTCFARHMPQLLALVFSAAVGVLTVITGIKKERLLVANLGMLMLTAVLVTLMYGLWEDVNLFFFGAVLLACGVIFLFVNKRLMKTFKGHKEAAAEENKTPLPEGTEADGNEDA